MQNSNDKERIVKYIKFVATSKWHMHRQKWFIVLTNKRLVFYALKGGGAQTVAGAVGGALIGLAAGFVIAIIKSLGLIRDRHDILIAFVQLGPLFAVIGMGIGVGLIRRSDPAFRIDVEALESALQESPEYYEFFRPQVPEYVERSPFMGGIKIHLAKHRTFSFAHEPLYSEIKGLMSNARGACGSTDT
jgi:ABC-type amino acid transport system permease subunit